MLLNIFSRKSVSSFCSRSIFYNQTKLSARLFPEIESEYKPFSKYNVKEALFSSGSIPFVSSGAEIDTNGALSVFRDGGMVDYHFNIETKHCDGIVLYPHFYDYALSGWFEKILNQRKASSQSFQNVVMLSPSRELIDRLPKQRLTDRNDFERMSVKERIKYWNSVVDSGKYLVEAFHNIVEKQSILCHSNPF